MYIYVANLYTYTYIFSSKIKCKDYAYVYASQASGELYTFQLTYWYTPLYTYCAYITICIFFLTLQAINF